MIAGLNVTFCSFCWAQFFG